jgi:hypothetical protein
MFYPQIVSLKHKETFWVSKWYLGLMIIIYHGRSELDP